MELQRADDLTEKNVHYSSRSHARAPTQFGTVLELMRQSSDRLPLDEVVTKRYGVAEAQTAIDDLKARKGIKLAIGG